MLARDGVEADPSPVAFGIAIRSLPVSFAASLSDGVATIQWSAVRERVAGPSSGWAREIPGGAEVGWGGDANYEVRSAHGWRVDASIEIDEEEAAIAFVLSVLPLVLPLFGLEPLHGAALCRDDGAILVLGPKGAGKSSTAGCLEEMGWVFLSDDACALDDRGQLWPGPPFLNPRAKDARQPVVGTYNGKLLRSPGAHDAAPRAVQRVVVLDPRPGEQTQIQELPADQAFLSILSNVRAPSFLAERRRGLQLRVVAALAGLPTAALSYDPDRSEFRKLGRMIASWVG